MGERVITVKGMGHASALPDWIKIIMSLEAKSIDYQQTVNLAAKQLEQLREALFNEGFYKNSIKTTSFSIDTHYQSVKDKLGNYKKTADGYMCSQNMYIGFEADSKKLHRVLNILSCCEAKPKFSIRYQLKDEKAIKQELLKNAIEDAKEKAKVISEAAEVVIGDIVSIDYDWSEFKFTGKEFSLEKPIAEPQAASMDIEPDYIEASDSVKVVWKIS